MPSFFVKSYYYAVCPTVVRKVPYLVGLSCVLYPKEIAEVRWHLGRQLELHPETILKTDGLIPENSI